MSLGLFLPRLAMPVAHSAATPVTCNAASISSCLDLAVDESSVNIDIATPAASGSFAYGSNVVNARTNAPGYSLHLSGSNNSSDPNNPNPNPTNNLSLIGTSANMNGALIAPVDYYGYPSQLPSNTWGYSIDSIISSNGGSIDATSALWLPVLYDTAPSTVIKTSNSTNDSTGESTTIYYGVNVSSSQPAGIYSANVLYTATADPFPAPIITDVSPNSGPIEGGNTITITGTNFYDVTPTTGVKIGTNNCTSFTVNSPTEITCIVPANSTAGSYNVTVTTAHGAGTLALGYTYILPATVTYVSPSMASTIAGTESGPALTIVGTDFTGANSVTIGGVACASFQVVSDTHIFCKAPSTINTTGSKAIVVDKSNTAESNNDIAVNYTDTNYPTLQASDVFSQCSTTAALFRDTRDSQLYYVKKMPDNKCWMVDSLKYANFGDLSQTLNGVLTVDKTIAANAANYDVAKYVDPNSDSYCMGNTNMPTNTSTRCGLLYNWYTATNGTGTYAESTAGNNVSGSICPANFRLPSAMSNGTTATSNGTSYAAADIAVLNASMNAGALTAGDTAGAYYAGWQPSGAWSGVFSGNWTYNLYTHSTYGVYWSSTADSATSARSMHFTGSSVQAGTQARVTKHYGNAVRCVMEEPLTPPSGSNPPNISSSNPAVLDVYPTTGWEGDTVAITSNALFTNVESVTIGGTSCQAYNVTSSSFIVCKLPAKTAGTTNEIVVMNNGTNVTSASTYNHMKVTYFDPSQNSVTVDGTNYAFYPNGFTGANCSALTANNDPIGLTPASAMAYVRDARNKQTYKVKKMADNKCWMVDNLKYIDTAMANTSDNTTGMVFNNGDHQGDNGSGAYNTVDGANTQSATNSDKAFYNNPMSTSHCYGLNGTIASTLTNCGYLYNWYAATNGTGTYDQSTNGSQAAGSICPANFRLPSSTSGTGGPTTNGTATTVADIPVLNASMNAGSLAAGYATSYPTNWQPTGAWGGTFSGRWNAAPYFMGSDGYFWSSTTISATLTRSLNFSGSSVNSGNSYNKLYGFAVRCVMEDPTPIPPAGSNPSNISSTNPAVLDVYPTTGWEDDVVSITSNALFTNVESVTIGGAACSAWGVINPSLITCKLPAKTAGTSNEIVVMNNGTNVTNASVYNHMKVTYFDPNSSTVNISGTTYNFYPNGFTSSNCSAMTPSNAAIGSTPPASMAYVRDTRNNQTYKVKKMVDNKCWMVDNLKYIDANMTFNNGDHLNNGGTTAFNTVNETDTQSTANSDKRFYNNPMSNSYCYGNTNMPANTLTNCGYLYNWYAATNGTGTYAQSTQGTNVAGDICPADFRLPSATSNGTTATSNGTSYNAADFAVLNASMNAGALTTGNTSYYYTNWHPSGSWGGAFSGSWGNGLGYMGNEGYSWSSTADSVMSVRGLNFYSGYVHPGSININRYDGLPVRCVLQ